VAGAFICWGDDAALVAGCWSFGVGDGVFRVWGEVDVGGYIGAIAERKLGEAAGRFGRAYTVLPEGGFVLERRLKVK
jgi:hypothetical protein